MQKKISVITINYNNKLGLEKTINSVVNQSYKDFEFIIIDGNSTDGSQDLVELYKSKVHYSISEPDTGVYNAMNKGIKVANGEYLLFLNSGDFLVDNDVLSKVLPELDSSISIYYGNIFYSKNEVQVLLNRPPDQLSFSYFLEYSLPHPASFIKKDLFERYFYYNENLKIVSDWEFFIYCICKQNESYKYINIVVSDFDNAGISSNTENLSKIIAERRKVLQNHFPLFIGDASLLKEIKSRRFQQILFIKKSKTRWAILKLILNIFQSKKQAEFTKYYTKI